MSRKLIGLFLIALAVVLSGCEPPLRSPAAPKTATPAAKATAAGTAQAAPATVTPPPLPVVTTPAPTPAPSPEASPKPRVSPIVTTPPPALEATPAVEPPPTPRPAPTPFLLRKGDTLSAVAARSGKRNLAFTFLWWNETNRAVVPFGGRHFTYVARPGTKFIILTYRFRNASNVEEVTPDLSSGTLSTHPKGYIYDLWQPPLLVDAQAYRPSESLPIEIAEFGASNGGNVRLLPDQTVEGRVVFETPSEMFPLEVMLPGIPQRMALAEQPLLPPTLAPRPVAAVPNLKKGETLPLVAAKSGRRNLALTFLWWNVRDRAVALFQGANYTYVARPGMKFIIVTYRFKNVSAMEEETPEINGGRIATQPRGFIYELWQTPPASRTEAYRPEPAFPREVIELGSSSGGGVRLRPEETVEGRAVFEIPQEMVPLEVNLDNIPVPILLTE